MHVEQNTQISLFIQWTFTCYADTATDSAKSKCRRMHFFSIKYQMDLDIMNKLKPPTSGSANE